MALIRLTEQAVTLALPAERAASSAASLLDDLRRVAVTAAYRGRGTS